MQNLPKIPAKLFFSILITMSLLASSSFCQPNQAPLDSKRRKELELELRALTGSSNGLSKEEIRNRKRRMREIYRMGGFSHKPSTAAAKRQRRFSEIQANPEELKAWLKEQDKRRVRNLGHGFSGERVSLKLLGTFDSEEALREFHEKNVGVLTQKQKVDIRFGDLHGTSKPMDARRRALARINQTLQTPSEIEISNLVPKFREAFDRVGQKFGPQWTDAVAQGQLRRSTFRRRSQGHLVENEFYLLWRSSTSRSYPFYERVRVFDPAGKELAVLEDESLIKIAPDGKYIVAFDRWSENPDGSLRIYSRTGRLLKEFELGDMTGPIVFSKDGRFFARYSSNRRRTHFFSEKGELLYELPPASSTFSGYPVAISTNGNLLTQAGDWFDLTGERLWSTKGAFSIRSGTMVLGPDSQLALTVEGFRDGSGQTLMVVAVDMKTGEIVEKIPYEQISADQCRFLDDDHLMTSGPALSDPDERILTRFFLYKIELH